MAQLQDKYLITSKYNNYRFALALRLIGVQTQKISIRQKRVQLFAHLQGDSETVLQKFLVDFAVVFCFIIARSEMKFHARPTWDA